MNSDSLRRIIHDLSTLIEKYGIVDDDERNNLVESLNITELQELCNCINSEFENDMMDLLSQGESEVLKGNEYYKLAAFGIAIDHAKVLLKIKK